MGFEHCHPAVNLIYFAAVISGTVAFRHPVFLLISFLCAFVYSVKRNGIRALLFNTALLPLIAVFSLYYGSYTHFGVTVLKQNLIGNSITQESLVYGAVLGAIASGVIMWFSCVYSVFSSDKVVYLFGALSPCLSLFLSIFLRMVPRIKKEAKVIHTARRGIGRGINQGSFPRRIVNGIRIFSVLITWTVDSLTRVSESMQSRGSTLRGRKAFSVYRFDNRDRAYVVGMFFCLTLVLMGVLLHQTDILYDPRIVFPPITPFSCVFYAGYAGFCLMPVGLELWTEYSFRRSRKSLP